MSRRVLAAGRCPPSASAAPGDAQPPAAQGSTEVLSPLFALKGNCSAGTALGFFLIYFLLSLPTSPMSDYLFQQHSAAFRGNRLCAQQIRAVDKLTALRRVYDFIDLRQRLASMETALLAPEPRRGTSGFVLLDLGKAHLYRCVLLIP